MSERRLRRADLVLIAGIGLVILLLFLAQKPWERVSGGTVVITVDGEEYGRFSLEETQTIEIQNPSGEVTNVLQIENGAAKMIEATCPDKLCIHQREIKSTAGTIVCLPNRVVVSIEGRSGSDVDVVAR